MVHLVKCLHLISTCISMTLSVMFTLQANMKSDWVVCQNSSTFAYWKKESLPWGQCLRLIFQNVSMLMNLKTCLYTIHDMLLHFVKKKYFLILIMIEQVFSSYIIKYFLKRCNSFLWATVNLCIYSFVKWRLFVLLKRYRSYDL